MYYVACNLRNLRVAAYALLRFGVWISVRRQFPFAITLVYNISLYNTNLPLSLMLGSRVSNRGSSLARQMKSIQ